MTSVIGSLTLPSEIPRWRLSGPAGWDVDALVAGLIGAGITIEPIEPTTDYALSGRRDIIEALSAELAGTGLSIAVDRGPTDRIEVQCEPVDTHPPRRRFTLYGRTAVSPVARAVDRGLTVMTLGPDRWAVSGRTRTLISWAASHLFGVDKAEAMQRLKLTDAIVDAEDAPPRVAISLPPRTRTTVEMTRDADGALVRVVDLEQDMTDEIQ